MKRKIFTASALGGGIGALIALQVNPYFWWIGLLIGGLAGYLSYEFFMVIMAAKAIGRFANPMGWRWRLMLLRFILAFYQAVIMWIAVIVLVVFFNSLASHHIEDYKVRDVLILVLVCSFVNFLLPICFSTPEEKEEEEIRREIRYFNPFRLYLYYLPLGILLIIRRVPRGVVFGAGLIKQFFILIHSESRLLCGFDAALGAAVGYFTGNVMIGALAGGVIGVLNYEIISKRFLKLAPLDH